MDPTEGRVIGRKQNSNRNLFEDKVEDEGEEERTIKINIERRRRDDYECPNKGGFWRTGLA